MNNKKGRFKGTGTVFAFTLKHSMNGKAFMVMTVIIPLLLFAGLFMASYLPSIEKDEEVFTHKVYIVDNTEFDAMGELFDSSYDKEKYDSLKTVTTYGGDAEKIVAAIPQTETDSFVISVDKTETDGVTAFKVTTIVPSWSEVPEKEYSELSNAAISCVDVIKVSTSGISYEKLMYLSSGIMTDVIKAGEEAETVQDFLIKNIVPMIYCLIIYMIVLLYGQSIGKTVAAEKNSRLMEMILTSIHPEALIIGKILAMCFEAVAQILLWIIGAVAGFFFGDYVAHVSNPEYVNIVSEAVKMFMENQTSFSAAMIVVAILATVFGFCIFGFLSGLIASGVGKPEELASANGVYQVFVIAGFFIAYFVMINENVMLYPVICILPVTSPFCLGAMVLVGSIELWQGIAGLAVMIVMCLVIAVLSAKVYRDKAFFNGSNRVAQILSLMMKRRA